MARRVFVAMGRFAVAGSPEAAPDVDAPLSEEDDRRRGALLASVSRETVGWSEDELRMASGVLDVLWHVPAYERLVDSWELDPDAAITALEWALSLMVDAIQSGRRPPSARPEARRRSSGRTARSEQST